MNPEHLLVFDIETVPDREHHEGTVPKPPFHKVVVIGSVGRRDVRFTCRCGHSGTSADGQRVATAEPFGDRATVSVAWAQSIGKSRSIQTF